MTKSPRFSPLLSGLFAAGIGAAWLAAVPECRAAEPAQTPGAATTPSAPLTSTCAPGRPARIICSIVELSIDLSPSFPVFLALAPRKPDIIMEIGNPRACC